MKRVKTSDESVRSSTTLQDDDDLTFIAEPDSVYFVITGSLGAGSRTGDLQFGWNLPGTTEMHGVKAGWDKGFMHFSGASSVVDPSAGGSYHQWSGPGNDGGDRVFQHLFMGFVVSDGQGGVVARQFAQATSQATPSKHLAGSFLLYMQLI